MVAFIYSFAEFLSCAFSNSWRLCYKLQVKFVHCAASSMVCVKNIMVFFFTVFVISGFPSFYRVAQKNVYTLYSSISLE